MKFKKVTEMNKDGTIKSLYGFLVIQSENNLPNFELKLSSINLVSEEEYQLKKNLAETTTYSYEYICAFFWECKQDELLFGKEYHWSFNEIEKLFNLPKYSQFYDPFTIKRLIKPTPF